MSNTMEPGQIAAVVSRLQALNRDAAAGYEKAAQDVQNPTLRELFEAHVLRRSNNESELGQVVSQLGGDQQADPSLTGAVHRAWIDVKSAVAGRQGDEIVDECLRGDKAYVEEYQKALEHPLPTAVRSLLQGHLNEAKETIKALETIKSLETLRDQHVGSPNS